ncbi:MAG: PspC domain-containing protein [Parachlamydiales bacterium]|nr:PspC domain-containing protein [Parachlamydiales bacterium]
MVKKIYRSQTNKKISGLCGGIGNYLNIDPTLIRLLMIVVLIFTGFFPVFIAYIIASIIIPMEPRSNIERSFKRLYRSAKNKKIAGVCGGIAEFFKMDATVIRLIFVFLFFLTAIVPMTFVYIIAWIVMPQKLASSLESDD